MSSKNKNLHNGFLTLVNAIEKLTDKKIDFSQDFEPVDMQELRRKEALEAHREIALLRRQKRLNQIESLHSSNIINPKWTFQTVITDLNNSQATASAEGFCASVNMAHSLGVAPSLLLIQGGPGVGKTVLCHCVANKVLTSSMLDVEIHSYSEIKRVRAPSSNDSNADKIEKQSLWDRMVSVDLLIIDGLCQNNESFTNFDRLTFPELLRLRRAKGLPLVITTSLLPSEIRDRIGEESYESIKEYSVLAVALFGQSRRADFNFKGIR